MDEREKTRRKLQEERRAQVRREYAIVLTVMTILLILALLKVGIGIWNGVRETFVEKQVETSEDSYSAGLQESLQWTEKPDEEMNIPDPGIDVQLLTVNDWSRPGIPTDKIEAVVVHYIGNPGTTAQQNHDYFENLKDYQDVSMSSNFLVGLEGEIIQNVPTNEVAYASNSANHNTVSVECCHPDETGKFTEGTYTSAVHLVAWLCEKFDLGREDIIRHYDVTGKECPLYFVRNPDEWERFKDDVVAYMQEYGV